MEKDKEETTCMQAAGKKKPTRKEKECFHCKEVGHLAKHCPQARGAGVQAGDGNGDGDEATLVYTPPRRHKFATERDRAAFAQRVRAFKHQSRKSHQLQPELYKPMMEEVVAYLVWAHGQAKALMVRARDVRLAFRTRPVTGPPGELTFADTSAMTGYITFSTAAIERGLRDASESGYPCEQLFLDQYCRGLKEEHLMWLLLHEFTHLFHGFNNDRHDEAFFEQVAALAEEHSFLFRSSSVETDLRPRP